MILSAGQRFRITDEESFVFVKSGNLEVYAVTQEKSSFRQIFLMKLEKDFAAYPSLDEFGRIDIMLYAVDDSEIEIIPFEDFEPQDSCKLMKHWFSELIKLSWLRLMADKGDDVLQNWLNPNFLNEYENDAEELQYAFEDNESMFSMLLGIRFQAEDKKFSKRLEVRSNHQKYLIDSAINSLLGKEDLIQEKIGDQNSKLEETAFIVTAVARALEMPINNISISPEIVKKLDQVGLIRRLVQKANMQIRLISLVDGWHRKDSGVMLGYFGEKKSLAAIIPVDVDRYKLVTAENPAGVTITDAVAAKIDKSAFICYAGFPTRKLSVMDLFKFMYRQCWKVDCRAIIFASFIAGLIPLITPIITESIFADIIPILDRQGLATVTQVSIVTAFTLAAVSIVRSVAVLRISTKLDMATEAALWGRLLTLPTKFFRKFTSGELSQRMGGLQAIKSLISGEFVSTVFNILFSFWSLILMCYYSLKLTATAMLVWIFYTGLMILIYRRVVTYQSGLIEAKNKTAGLVQQIFTGLAKFRIQGAEEQAYYLWSKAFGEEWKWNLKLRWQGNYSGIISGMQPFILTMILYYVVIYVVNENAQGISYAQFIAFQSAFTAFNSTVNTFIPLIGQIYSIKPQIEQLRPILEAEPEIAEDRVDADVLTGAIEVNHITFAYGEDKPDVLHDVSFRIGAGENVAIVGKSGCGKSTLIRLLLGFEEPKSGAVYFDGQDLAELSLPSVRSQMGVVLQNGQLMSGDIFTNIVGTTALTMNDAWAAAEAAGIADDIKKMPMGMQTVISEGSSNISGGQRQRILIARALAAKPAILIFDEATSALDNRTQAIVTESLEKMHATRIVVAHRLSTIRNCDRILVMDRGRLVESGTFDELVAQGGLFAGLVKRQVA